MSTGSDPILGRFRELDGGTTDRVWFDKFIPRFRCADSVFGIKSVVFDFLLGRIRSTDSRFLSLVELGFTFDGYWPTQALITGDSGQWDDASTNEAHATTHGGIVPNGYSLYFDGVNDYANVPQGEAQLRPTAAITVGLWCSSLGGDTNPTCLMGCANNGGWIVAENESAFGTPYLGYIGFAAKIGDGYKAVKVLRSSLNSFGMNFICFTYDGVDLKFYLNGELVNTNNIGSGAITYDQAMDTVFGTDAGTLSGFFNGYIKSPFLIQSALTADEVKTLNVKMSTF